MKPCGFISTILEIVMSKTRNVTLRILTCHETKKYLDVETSVETLQIALTHTYKITKE